MFDRRAYMLDVSRDRVPTMDTLEWLAGALALLGFNELQLYVEHTFAYSGHEIVWRESSALTFDEMQRLGRICQEEGIDLVGNMNCFGHMERWLAHERYREMAECPDGAPSPFGGGTTGPMCLAPTDKNAEFGVSLARQMAKAVSYPRIHIGGDEPFQLGEGVSASAVAQRGRQSVYVEHLSKIIEPLAAEGHEVMFWADQFRQDRSLLDKIPAKATPVVWNYEAPSDQSWISLLSADLLDRLGLPDDAHLGFESHARLFIEADMAFWVAPGTGSWNTLIGRNRNAAANIIDAAEVGQAHESPGYLLTDWGDNGHFQPLPVSLPSMVRAGAAANGQPIPDHNELGERIDEILGCQKGIGALIDQLGGIGESLGLVSINGSPIFYALCTTAFGSFGALDQEGVTNGLAVLAEADERFSEPIGGARGEVVAAEMRSACRLAEIGLRRLAVEHGLDVQLPTPDELADAVQAQRAAWLLTSRPGGLDDSLSKLA